MLNILTLLVEQPEPMSQNELCRRLHLSKQTVASVIDSLEKRGMAVRRVSEEDRRSRMVCLTGQGEAFAREISVALHRFELHALSMLSAEEQAALVDTTNRFWHSMVDALEQEETGETAF